LQASIARGEQLKQTNQNKKDKRKTTDTNDHEQPNITSNLDPMSIGQEQTDDQ
jgi:hypothetical protein